MASNLFKVFTFLLLLSSTLLAEGAPFKPLRTDTPPVIDGILDDAVWQNAPSETGFKTWTPDFEQPMAEKTVVYYAYDRENLYFAYRCFDSEPDKIKSSMTSRDKIFNDDWVCLNLDSFNDQQALYAFYVNPLGVQGDSRYAMGREDTGFDVIWFSKGQIDDKGYTIEIQIPFKSIRFANKKMVEMGIIFERNISKRQEKGTYPALDPKMGVDFLTQTRPLLYENIKYYKLLEVMPGMTYARSSSINNGDLIYDGDNSELSLTAKYGLTSKLVLDGTLNPDFSQVEADAGQIDFNQRYALFYPEKRPFFFEGNEEFNFAGNSFGSPIYSIVHTRQIVNPSTGIKLSGKVGKNGSIASIYAIDELPEENNEGESAHFSILRYKKALTGDNYLGGIYTSRETKNGYNRVYGSDGQIRINNSSKIGFYGYGSNNQESSAAISTTGHAIGGDYNYTNRSTGIVIGGADLSDNFMTKSGFVTRTGIFQGIGFFSRRFYPASEKFRRIETTLFTNSTYDKASEMNETSNQISNSLLLKNNVHVSISITMGTEVFLDEKFDTNRISLTSLSQVNKNFYISGGFNRGQVIRYVGSPYTGIGNNASLTVRYQWTENISSNLSYNYSDFYNKETDIKEFDYSIIRSRNTFQFNKYLFVRGIFEYNSFRRELLTDFLASFTYIPGTVIHFGYGSLYRKTRWETDRYINSSDFLETDRGFFFKTSYLWRM